MERFYLKCNLLGLAGALVMVAGCSKEFPNGAVVLTQTPIEFSQSKPPETVLDERYPAGSRVVLAIPPILPEKVQVLSKGLVAAGGPVVCPSGRRIYFVGKKTFDDQWQIYETGAGWNRPKAITSMRHGAMDPAVISEDDLVVSSPVAKASGSAGRQEPSGLYRLIGRKSPSRLTFGTTPAFAPTVLKDGKILFVAGRSPGVNESAPGMALFTMNRDGTEVTAFALNNETVPRLGRPRELGDGRIGFLASTHNASDTWADAIRMARPFASRHRVYSAAPCRSIEPEGQGTLLVSVATRENSAESVNGSFAIHRVGPAMEGVPVFDDPAWHDIEAVPVGGRAKPMGHISSVVPEKKTGTILCLDVNFARDRSSSGGHVQAQRVRILTGQSGTPARVLGEVELQPDGSFMAEVPADTALGFEALDSEGHVLSALPPAIWVRPGENRGCLGCHEPSNRSPRNVRPIAATLPPVSFSNALTVGASKTGQKPVPRQTLSQTLSGSAISRPSFDTVSGKVEITTLGTGSR